MTPRRIAMYLRVSTEDQAREGFSLGNQEESNRSYIQMKFGRDAEIFVYQDIESGYSIERKHYLRLMEDCRQRKIDALVIWRLDRFTRNTTAGLAALSDLTVKLGLPVYSVSEGQVDFNDPNNKLMNTFLVGMAEFERNRIQQRVMPGMKKGASIGHYQGTRYVILGARYNKPMQRLEWIPSEVKLLKVLFERVASGESVRSVAKYLHTRGYRNRLGKPLGIAILCHALKREIYTDGYYRWNGIISEKPILEPIIDRSTWEKANESVRINTSDKFRYRGGTRRDDSPYILQGVLKCQYCGSNLIGHGNRFNTRYYVCSTYYAKTKAACKGQFIKAEPVEAQARNILKEAVSNKDILVLAQDELSRIAADRNPELLAGIRLGERKLRDISEMHRKLLELRYSDAVSVDQFKNENNRLLEEQRLAQQSLDQLRQEYEGSRLKTSHLTQTFSILENFDAMYDSMEVNAKKSLFNLVFAHMHAKSLGQWKPKFIDAYELAEPFKNLLEKEVTKNGEKFNFAPKIPCETLGIQSLHMAVR